MCLDHRRAAGRQRGGRIAAGHREREREVARTEHADRTKRHQHPPQVGAGTHRRLAGVIDGGLDVAAVVEDGGEEPQLERGPGQLTVQPGRAERGLAIGERDDRVAVVFERVGQRRQQPGPTGSTHRFE